MTSWAVAIFSSREDEKTLSASVEAVLIASEQRSVTIDVIVNGNLDLARGLAEKIRSTNLGATVNGRIRIWYIIVADKAHAWNTFLREIYPDADLAFCVDGYAQVEPDALGILADRLAEDAHPWGASGMPSYGRSAAKLREQKPIEGEIHGNLYVVRGATMRTLRERGFHLPLGIYRTDPLLGAAINFSLDPAANAWDPSRIRVCPEATWRFTPLSMWKLRDLRTHWQRVKRQAQGRLENLAVREHLAVNKRRPEDLPVTNAELVSSWITAFPGRARRLYWSNPLCWFGARTACRDRDWSEAQIQPELIAEFAPQSAKPGQSGEKMMRR